MLEVAGHAQIQSLDALAPMIDDFKNITLWITIPSIFIIIIMQLAIITK
jgi:hypothetical protein